MQFLDFELLSVKCDKKNGNILEIQTQLPPVESKHIFLVKRRAIDVETIQDIVRNKFEEQLKDSMFSDNVKQQMEQEIASRIDTEVRAIQKLPEPCVFYGYTSEFKNGYDQKLKTQINTRTVVYLLENKLDFHGMKIEIVKFPGYTDVSKREEEFESLVDEFRKKIVDDADGFSELVCTPNVLFEFDN